MAAYRIGRQAAPVATSRGSSPASESGRASPALGVALRGAVRRYGARNSSAYSSASGDGRSAGLASVSTWRSPAAAARTRGGLLGSTSAASSTGALKGQSSTLCRGARGTGSAREARQRALLVASTTWIALSTMSAPTPWERLASRPPPGGEGCQDGSGVFVLRMRRTVPMVVDAVG